MSYFITFAPYFRKCKFEYIHFFVHCMIPCRHAESWCEVGSDDKEELTRVNEATSTRIRMFLKTQLFFYGLAFRPHLNEETVTENGTFRKRRFPVLVWTRIFLKTDKKVAFSNENGYVWTRPESWLVSQTDSWRGLVGLADVTFNECWLVRETWRLRFDWFNRYDSW